MQKASIVYGIGYGDPDIKNEEGLSPLDLARMLEYDEEKRIIKEIYKKCNLTVKTFCAYCDQRCKQACSRCNLTYYCTHTRIYEMRVKYELRLQRTPAHPLAFSQEGMQAIKEISKKTDKNIATHSLSLM